MRRLGGGGVIEAYQEQAERLADLLFEQLERLGGSDHEQAYILTLVAALLIDRVSELGEVVEFEASDLDDRSALQMATALQAHCGSVQTILDRLAGDPRFGLLPRGTTGLGPLRPRDHRGPAAPRQPRNGHRSDAEPRR